MEPLCTINPNTVIRGSAAAALSELYRRTKALGATHMTGGANPFYQKSVSACGAVDLLGKRGMKMEDILCGQNIRGVVYITQKGIIVCEKRVRLCRPQNSIPNTLDNPVLRARLLERCLLRQGFCS